MSTHDTRRRQLLVAGLAGAVSGSAAAAPSNAESPAGFWSQLAGTWLGELSYLDGTLRPIIQSYHSVVEMTLSADRLDHAEYKFYPPGTALARNVGGSDLPADQGIEVITSQVGIIDQGRWTPSANEVYQLVDEATIVRHLLDPDTGVPRYVTYWTLTSARTLLITNLGILSTRLEADYYNRPVEPPRPNTRLGELKGCSVFRYVRLGDGRLDAERQRLAELYNVTRAVDRRPSSTPPTQR
jgi:hypothetical protein